MVQRLGTRPRHGHVAAWECRIKAAILPTLPDATEHGGGLIIAHSDGLSLSVVDKRRGVLVA